MTMESSSPLNPCESDLHEIAERLGVSRKTLLSAILVEFSLLPKKKQFEIVGDYFTRLSDDDFLHQ